METKHAIGWGTAVMTIAMLNVFDVLPDWATITAVLTLPLMLSWQLRLGCGDKRHG